MIKMHLSSLGKYVAEGHYKTAGFDVFLAAHRPGQTVSQNLKIKTEYLSCLET